MLTPQDQQQPYYDYHRHLVDTGLDTLLSSSAPHGFAAINGSHDDFSGSNGQSTFGNLVSDAEFAAAFAQFQSCNDCTPATMTTIPHHHHNPSGRLAGASATLDGHFCCSWLIHDQPCFLCFQSAEALDNHIKNDHAGKDGTYRCFWQDCSKHDNITQIAGAINFGNKPKLMRHVHSHTGFKPFPCSYPGCEKGFVTKEQLRNHETTHTKSRKYKCDQCDKAFAVKSALTTHVTAVHDEKKIHSCDICGKAFADSSNLSKHKQTHFREIATKKRRNTRADSHATSTTRSSPSISTASVDTATPIMGVARLQDFSSVSPMYPGSMGPPAAPKYHIPSAFSSVPYTYGNISGISTTSSPPPEAFDPDCYCCDQQCPLPEGPASPCNEPDDCELEGFCCDERCTPPNGLVAPCPEPEACDMDGFCDLRTCLGDPESADHASSCAESSLRCDEPLLCHQIEQLKNFQMEPQRSHHGQGHGHGDKRSMSHRELEELWTHLHAS